MSKEDIARLIWMADAIYADYIVLRDLEIAGKKTGEEYSNLIEKLKYDKNIFDGILDKIDNYEIALDVYNWLISLKRFSSSYYAAQVLKLSFNLKMEEKDDSVLVYIKNRLYQRILHDPKYALAMLDAPLEMDEVIEKIVEFRIEYQYAIINDIYTLFLTLLAGLRDKSTDLEVKAKFEKMKYCYGFILPALEDYLIERKFLVDSKPYVMHHTLAAFYQMPESSFLDSKREIILNVVNGNLGIVQYLNDENFCDYQRLALAMDTEATIRACLVIADPETRKEIVELLQALITILEKTGGYQIIEEILRKIPEKLKDDLALVQVVSIGR